MEAHHRKTSYLSTQPPGRVAFALGRSNACCALARAALAVAVALSFFASAMLPGMAPIPAPMTAPPTPMSGAPQAVFRLILFYTISRISGPAFRSLRSISCDKREFGLESVLGCVSVLGCDPCLGCNSDVGCDPSIVRGSDVCCIGIIRVAGSWRDFGIGGSCACVRELATPGLIGRSTRRSYSSKVVWISSSNAWSLRIQRFSNVSTSTCDIAFWRPRL